MPYDERVFYVTRNLIEYGNYGKDPVRAAHVIHKHFPEICPEKIQSDLNVYINAYRDAAEFLECHRDYYFRRYQNRIHGPFFANTDDEKLFYNKHINIHEDIIRGMLYWIFDWRHVR